MPIWNINSFAEYYLQIQRFYKNDYVTACNEIAKQRTKMQKQLSGIEGIKVYPSQANYIMCELTEGITSFRLAMLLIKKYNIFPAAAQAPHRIC